MRIVGIAKAKELVFTGKAINASSAKEIGLVNHVFEQSALMDEAVKMAKTIAANSTLAFTCQRLLSIKDEMQILIQVLVWSCLHGETVSQIQNEKKECQIL